MARGMLSSSRVAGRNASNNESPQSASRVWTPLRENYFALPAFSTRERAYFVRKSCEAALELVKRAQSTDGPMVWRHIEKHNGVQIYAGSPRSNTTGTARSAAIMCGVSSVPGTMKEVASLFELGSTRQMKEFAQTHREWFYDGVVLHTLAPRTKEKPLHQVTAKWMVIQMPHGVPHRDFCYLECQDKFVDAKGRKGWVLGQHSIKLPGCEDLKKEFEFVRGSLYNSGLVVVESEERPGHVDVIYLVQLNLKDHTPVPMSLLRARVLCVAQIRYMLRSKRLNEQRYLSDLELVPRKYRTKCAVCRDSFSLLLLRKMSCRKCGEVVCAACSKEFSIENRNFAETNGKDDVRKLRICMHCFQLITNAPKPTSALVEPPHASTMSMSFLSYNDDRYRASNMASREGQHGRREEGAPKIFLQSMRREKSSSHRMSSTSPIPGFGASLLPSRLQNLTQGEPDADLYQRSQHYQQQSYGHSHNRRESQRMQSSDFRPSQSLSFDDPIARGEGCYTLRMPGQPAVQHPVSIFDRPAVDASRHPHHGLSHSSSSDMFGRAGSGNVSNFSRLQELSSRERLEQLQREDEYATRSGIDQFMPDVYMSALQQASRDKHEFDMPPPICQAPPSDFGAYGATSDDHPILPDFGPFSSTLDDLNGPAPLDLSALTTPSFPIDISSMSTEVMHVSAPRDGGKERRLLRRGHESEQGRESTSSESSANSIDIDTYEDLSKLAVHPPISEQQYDEEGVGPSNTTDVEKRGAARESGKIAAWIYENDEDSETSMGASDDEEEHCASVMEAPSLMTSPPHRPIDDNAEETKTQAFAGSPVLPAPSPSAHTSICKMVERPAIADLSIGSLSGDCALADIKTIEVEPKNAIKEAKTVAKDLIDHDPQLQRSKVKGFAEHRCHQKHEPPKQSQVQGTDDKQREDDTEADFFARENTVPGCDIPVEDQEGIFLSQLKDGKYAVPPTPSEVSSTAAGQANEVFPPHERTTTSPNSKCGSTPALTKHIRSNSREDVCDADDVEECQKPLNNRNGSADHVVLNAQKEASDIDSLTPESTSRFDDRFDTGDSLDATIVEDAVLAKAQRDSETARPRVQGIAEQDQTTTFASPVIPMSAVLPANNKTMQTSGDYVMERHLQASGRNSFSSFPSGSARGSSMCSMSLGPVTPPATPLSLSPVAIDMPLDTSASLAAALPASDATSSFVRISDSSEVAVSQQRKMNTPRAYIPDHLRTTGQLQVVRQNVSTTIVPITTTPSSTPRQSSDSYAALDSFQLDFSASINVRQQQKAQAVGIDDIFPQLMPSDERSRATCSGSNDV